MSAGRWCAIIVGSNVIWATTPTMTLEEAVELVETRLDDLQAEMEAGVRCVAKLRDAAVDERVATALRAADQNGLLMLRIRELRSSLAEQRGLMQQLRREVRTLRGRVARVRNTQGITLT
jgi:hypothetical protein